MRHAPRAHAICRAIECARLIHSVDAEPCRYRNSTAFLLSVRRPEAPPKAHYDGLPVDFVAEAIATLGANATDRFRTYNVVNPHDDGISLDQFVDWLIDAGNPIERVDDYGEWLVRFEAAMRALPDKQRRYSELTLLEAFKPPAEVLNSPVLPAERFRSGVRESCIGPEHDIPHISAELISKYVADLRQLELL